MRILGNRQDEIAWIRSLTLQPGIGAGYAEKIFLRAEKEESLEKIASPSFGEELPPRVREGLYQFKKILRGLLKAGLEDRPDALIEEVLEGGYNKYVLMNFENAQDRLEDLRELVNFAHTYQSLKDFLADATLREGYKGETIAGDKESEAFEDELILSTIHQAKGLEWRAVFVVALSEGQFPHAKSMQEDEGLEEERRLFYVAATRAKEELYLLHPMMRYDYSAGMIIQRPSVFLLELPSSVYDEVEVEESEGEKTIYLE